MAQPQNFRSAFNGFNREDVVRYLEYLNAKHQNQINQLTAEAEELRSRLSNQTEAVIQDRTASLQTEIGELTRQLEQAREELEQARQPETGSQELTASLQAENGELSRQLEQNQQELEQTRQTLEQTQRELEEARADLSQARQELADARPVPPIPPEKPAQPPQPDIANPELAAYRRAEFVEQAAKHRAELIYHQANGVLTEATAKVENLSGSLTELADQTMSQLTQLQVAVSGSKQALQDALAIMKAIRPNP